MDYFVHHTAVVDSGAIIGSGSKIWHFSHIMSGAKIGANCVIGQNVFVGSGVLIGNRVKIQNNVSVYTGCIIEDDVFLGPSAVFTNVVNPRAFIERKDQYRKTIVKQGASVGANATIVCGTTIGKYALIGAGAVVTKDVPDHALIVGVPGEVRGWVCICGEQLAFNSSDVAECSVCGRPYEMIDGMVVHKQTTPDGEDTDHD